jgi:hypothetical protein
VTDTADDVESFHVREDGTIGIESRNNIGSVGTKDDACEASKSEAGNRKHKALFGRSKVHNLQTIVRPCGIFVAQAPFYNAEAVSNVLVSIGTPRLLFLMFYHSGFCTSSIFGSPRAQA